MLLDLQNPQSWPPSLKAALDAHRATFEAWELDLPGKSARNYDPAMVALGSALEPLSVLGWHCTRLTADEAAEIETNGLAVLDVALLERRIDAQVAKGALTARQAALLRSRHQAGERNRGGMAWFCFFPPRLAGQAGLERLLTNWGGEALYNSHEDDPDTGPSLREIGVPSLVEAAVPIRFLSSPYRAATAIARLDLIHRGKTIREPSVFEDYSVRAIDPTQIRRVIRFPDQEFIALTGCGNWKPQLRIGRH